MNTRMFIPIFVILAVLFGACGIVNVDLNVDRGSGNVITESRPVSNFDKVTLAGIGNLELKQGDTEKLEIEAEDNVLPLIKTEVVDNTLKISYDRKTVVPTKDIKFKLTMPKVHALDTQGVSNIQADTIKTDSLIVNIGGTGNVNLHDLTTQKLDANVSGAGNFTANGQADDLQITLSGAGNFNGEDLKTKNSTVTISGLGRVVTWVTDALNVTISGTGGVDYYGSPQVSQQISGLGKLTHKGDK